MDKARTDWNTFSNLMDTLPRQDFLRLRDVDVVPEYSGSYVTMTVHPGDVVKTLGVSMASDYHTLQACRDANATRGVEFIIVPTPIAIETMTPHLTTDTHMPLRATLPWNC